MARSPCSPGPLSRPATAHTLDALWRFTNRWEADATRDLRIGSTRALDAYAERGRLHDGDTDTMTETAIPEPGKDDLAAGKTSMLIAQDRDTVTALNARARADRQVAGHLTGPEATLHDGTSCSVGDWITTRRNERRIPTAGGGYVRNGAAWTVTAVHEDGSIEITPREHADLTQHQEGIGTHRSGRSAAVRLPARYVTEHVELGYATPIHRAQGATVDTTHVLVRPGMTRQALYVAMSRGRHANHAYTALDGLIDTEDHQRTGEVTGRQILERVLATDGAEHSATTTLRRRQNDATSLRRLLPIRHTLNSAAERAAGTDGPDLERAADEVSSLIRLRAALQRADTTTPPPPHSASCQTPA